MFLKPGPEHSEVRPLRDEAPPIPLDRAQFRKPATILVCIHALPVLPSPEPVREPGPSPSPLAGLARARRSGAALTRPQLRRTSFINVVYVISYTHLQKMSGFTSLGCGSLLRPVLWLPVLPGPA
jgi:hypothetical protein